MRAHQRWPARTIIYDPGVRVAHRVPARRASVAYFLARCYGEGRSKALVSERVGRRDALSSELAYATRVLPAGVAARAARRDRAATAPASARATAIVAGLAATAARIPRRARSSAPRRGA